MMTSYSSTQILEWAMQMHFKKSVSNDETMKYLLNGLILSLPNKLSKKTIMTSQFWTISTNQ